MDLNQWNKSTYRQRYQNTCNFKAKPNIFYSQESQDSSLENCIFKGYKNGVFMDVGAHDGVDLNNTLFFEATHNWTGINIEPIKSVYNRLITNRPSCINLNVAIYDEDKMIDFRENTGYSEMLSGINECLRSSHIERIEGEIARGVSGPSRIKQIQANRIETICDNYNIKHINYLSIDVEGAEKNVIYSINFDKLFIDVIGFEDNYGRNDSTIQNIINYLYSKNFRLLPKHNSDIFMIHNNSIFN
tara:strand:+ start:1229 stop:1963 length:735 start_codon:yes stop_codon:yes gene_type:complete